MLIRRSARYILAVVRIVNGVLGLFAPEVLIKRLDATEPPSPAAIYAFRLFGDRTILLGLDLLIRPEAETQRALRQGVLIHGSDFATVALLRAQHKLPPRTAALVGAISGTNLALAIAGLERGA